MRLFLSARPRTVGEPSVIKQGFPKTGGVIGFYDFLNSPAAISLAVSYQKKQTKGGLYEKTDNHFPDPGVFRRSICKGLRLLIHTVPQRLQRRRLSRRRRLRIGAVKVE
jgi:hypothetical protein